MKEEQTKQSDENFDAQVRAAFAKLYPSDIGLLELSENNPQYRLNAIAVRHRWIAFDLGAKAAVALTSERAKGQGVSQFYSQAEELAKKLQALEVQRDELLDALLRLIDDTQQCGEMQWCGEVELSPWEHARAAIAKAQASEPAPKCTQLGSEWTPCMKLPVVVHVRNQREGEKHVSTREGITPVKPDDLIMRGVSGEEYPIGREIFEKTYTFDTSIEPAPKREWVGLTTDEMKEVADRDHLKPPNVPVAFRAIESKLKELNNADR